HELPQGAKGPIPLFAALLGLLMQIERPRKECRAWVATFSTQPSSATPTALRGCRIMLYATSQEEAEEHLNEVLDAIQPGTPPARASTLKWAIGSKVQQPAGPVFPGVQCVLAE